MSMLAERRRKQKWSLNPRGKLWSEDSNKFGQKLMEKMGWTPGKGLGAQEDGMIDNVKVSYKNDSKGMGYKESDDKWTTHEENFTELLSSLSGNTNLSGNTDLSGNTNLSGNTDLCGNTNSASSEIKVSSLEQKSQKSRARVHYHKFTRGKDLSRYSEKDLANIFGKKTLKPEKSAKVDTEQVDKSNDGEKSYGVETYNSGSMLDYFKKKLPNFGRKGHYEIGRNGSESESELATGFGFGFQPDEEAKKSKVGNFTSFITFNKGSERQGERGDEKETDGEGGKGKRNKQDGCQEGEGKTEEEKAKLDQGAEVSNGGKDDGKRRKKKNGSWGEEVEKAKLDKEEEVVDGEEVLVNGKEVLVNGKEILVNGKEVLVNGNEKPKTSRRKKKNGVQESDGEEEKKNGDGEVEVMNGKEDKGTKRKKKKMNNLEISSNANSTLLKDEDEKLPKNGKEEEKTNNKKEHSYTDEAVTSVNVETATGQLKKKKKKRKNENSNTSIDLALETPNKKAKSDVSHQRGTEEIATSEEVTNMTQKAKNLDQLGGTAKKLIEVEEPKEIYLPDEEPKVRKKSKKLNRSEYNHPNAESNGVAPEEVSGEEQQIMHGDVSADAEPPKGQKLDKKKKKKRKNEDHDTPFQPGCVEETPKKKKKLKESTNDEQGISNPGFDPLFGRVVVERHSLVAIEEAEEGEGVDEVETPRADERNGATQSNEFEDNSVAPKENKRQKKAKNDGSLLNSSNKKTKGAKNQNLGLENAAFGADVSADVSSTSPEESKQLKSGKKAKKVALDSRQSSGLENLAFQDKPYDSTSKSSSINSDIIQEECRRTKGSKKAKTVKVDGGLDNLAFRDNSSNSIETSNVAEALTTPSEECKGPKGGKRSKNDGFDNLAFSEAQPDASTTKAANFLEVARKTKRKKVGVENPNFDDQNDAVATPKSLVNEASHSEVTIEFDGDQQSFHFALEDAQGKTECTMEVKRKKKKSQGIANPALDVSTQSESTPEQSDLPQLDLMLNTVSTPVVKKDKRDKNIDAINRNELLDINDRVIRQSKKGKRVQINLEKNVTTFMKTLDGCQAQVENDLNEAKLEMVGEVGNPDGDHEKLPDGTRLKFRLANFGRIPSWGRKSDDPVAKKSYRHLIKGDIIVGFKNTNLHEIKGYGKHEET